VLSAFELRLHLLKLGDAQRSLGLLLSLLGSLAIGLHFL
jgi:hypothetical protein